MKTIYNIKTYDKYKDSGIEWIGEIPEKWKLTKIGQLYIERNIKVSDKEYLPLSVTKVGIVPQLENAAKTDNGDNRKLVKINDFVINSRSDRRGSCGISEYEGSVSLINTVLAPRNNMFNKYYNYTFKSECFADEFYKWGSGIVDDLWSTKWLAMKNIYIPYPEIEEQQQIADYLDNKCGEVDRVVEVQKQIIEKLKEYKQSVITEAVTKGLDKNTSLKDSGIEWIGKIPQDWKVLKLKYISDFNQEVLSENTDKNKVINYIEIGSVTNEKGISDYQTLTFENAPSRARRIVRNGDTILSTVRTYLKAIAYIDNHYNNFICSTGFAVFTPNKNILPKFLFHALHSEWFVSTVEANSVGISYPAINTTNIINYKLAIPSVKEQEQILCYLDNKCSKIDKAISEKEVLIEKLTQYKKSLIYECVTGKRRVSERHCEECK